MRANSAKYGWNYPSARLDDINFLITGVNVVNKKALHGCGYIDIEHTVINYLQNAMGHIGEK
jgi:hypothetical protein